MTEWTLSFSDRFDYSSFSNVRVPVTLSSSLDKQILIGAQVDTGSTFCIFQRVYGDMLGLDTEAGAEQRIETATGSFTAYGHEVSITAGQLEWEAVVYFAAPDSFEINVVGRVGFLDRLRVGLVDYEQTVYLGAYRET